MWLEAGDLFEERFEDGIVAGVPDVDGGAAAFVGEVAAPVEVGEGRGAEHGAEATTLVGLANARLG